LQRSEGLGARTRRDTAPLARPATAPLSQEQASKHSQTTR
jgi:hypothetical protein